MLSRLRRFQFFILARSAGLVFATAGLFCVCLLVSVHGQQLHKEDKRYEVIDPVEGERRMVNFRRQRLDGDYCFHFELEHLPRRGESVRYYGTMWGSWNELGPLNRIELATEQGRHPIDT